jgi:hypothetical protein
MQSSGMLHRVALVRTDVSEERWEENRSMHRLLVTANVPSSPRHPDDGGATFLRNVRYYKSYTA